MSVSPPPLLLLHYLRTMGDKADFAARSPGEMLLKDIQLAISYRRNAASKP